MKKKRLCSSVRKIEANRRLVAIVIPKSFRFKENGIEFYTGDRLSQQLGYMKRPAGHKIEAHRHILTFKKMSLAQETLLVRSGRIRVDLYSDDKKYLTSETLKSGDVILLAGGGHAVHFLAPSELIEVKQGPQTFYRSDKKGYPAR